MSAAAVFSGDIYNSLKETLEEIVDDKTDGYENSAIYKKWVSEKNMTDQWEEDLEMGGPGLAAERAEGSEIPTGTVREGYIKRYVARNFGLRLIISREAMKDRKYEEAIRFAGRLKRAMWKTVDIDVTNILIRGHDSNYPGGDNVQLWSNAHTLPHGGTWSNIMATPMSPSRAAVIIATSQIAKYPGHDGVTEGYSPTKVLCPTEQWAVWKGLVLSEKAPENDHNEINVVKDLFGGYGDVVPNKYWNNTTTNWALKTDCPDGFNHRWREKPYSSTWVDNSNLLMNYSINARWDNGWSDARCTYGVNA